VHALEYPLWGSKIGLAGRVDCVAEYKGVKSIIDFKGSTNRKREEDIENYKLQATAYALLWQERFEEKIETIVILITCEDGSVQEFIDKPINYVGKLFDVIQKYKEKFNESK
jgi:genome maintenance exonuclease 1